MDGPGKPAAAQIFEDRMPKRSLARAYIDAGWPDDANAVAREMGDTSHLTREIRRGLVDPRYRTEARAALAAWRATAPDAATTPDVQFAFYYAYLGVPDSAFAMLRRGAEARHPAVAAALDTRPFDALRTDPRWAEIVRAVRGAGAR